MMQETIKPTFPHHKLIIKFDQNGLVIKELMLFINPKIHLLIDQICYVKLRKRFIWFGSEGFEINYRQQPKGALYGYFFVSKQPQAWIDAFSAAGIKLIPSP